MPDGRDFPKATLRAAGGIYFVGADCRCCVDLAVDDGDRDRIALAVEASRKWRLVAPHCGHTNSK